MPAITSMLLGPVLGLCKIGVGGSIKQIEAVQRHLRLSKEKTGNRAIFRTVSTNHHLVRGVVLAYNRATLEVLATARAYTKQSPDHHAEAEELARLDRLARKELNRLIRNALDYSADIIDSPILAARSFDTANENFDSIVDDVLEWAGVYIAPDDKDSDHNHAAAFEAANKWFEPVFRELVHEEGALPSAIGRAVNPGPEGRCFGELLLAAYADILKSASLPEIRIAQELANQQTILVAVKQLAQDQGKSAAADAERDAQAQQRYDAAYKEWMEQAKSFSQGLTRDLRETMRETAAQVIEHHHEALDEQTRTFLQSISDNTDIFVDLLSGLEGHMVSIEGRIAGVFDTVARLREEILDELEIIKTTIGRLLPDFCFLPDRKPSDLNPEAPDRFVYSRQYDDYQAPATLDQIKRGLLDADRRGDGLLWQALVGSAGSGKSRLALELLMDPDLEAAWPVRGFVYRELVDGAGALKITQSLTTPALLVVDYVASQAEIVPFLKNLSRASRRDGFPKLRVLLLERQLSDPVFEVLDADTETRDARADQGVVRLQRLPDSKLRQIMRDRAGDAIRPWSPEQLMQLLDVYDEFRTPLSAAILGDQIGKGVIDQTFLKGVDREESHFALHQMLVDQEEARWRSRLGQGQTLNDAQEERFRKHLSIAALAALMQTLSFDTIASLLNDRLFGIDWSKLIDPRFYEDERRAFSRYISGYSEPERGNTGQHGVGGDHAFYRIQPDLLAESFVLKQALRSAQKWCMTGEPGFSDILAAAWHLDAKSTAVFVRQCFQDFPAKTAGLGFLLPRDRGLLASGGRSVIFAGLLRNLVSDVQYLCQGRPARAGELDLLAQVVGQVDDWAIRWASEDAEVAASLATALAQAAQIAGRAINEQIEVEELAEDQEFQTAKSVLRSQFGQESRDKTRPQPSRAKALSPEERQALAAAASDAIDLLRDIRARTHRLIDAVGWSDPDTVIPASKVESTFIGSVLWDLRHEEGYAPEPLSENDIELRCELYEDCIDVACSEQQSPERDRYNLCVMAALTYTSARIAEAKEGDPGMLGFDSRLVQGLERILMLSHRSEWGTPSLSHCYTVLQNVLFSAFRLTTLENKPRQAHVMRWVDMLVRVSGGDIKSLDDKVLARRVGCWKNLFFYLREKYCAELEIDIFIDECLQSLPLTPGGDTRELGGRIVVFCGLLAAAQRSVSSRSADLWGRLGGWVGETDWPEAERRTLVQYSHYIQHSALSESDAGVGVVHGALDQFAAASRQPDDEQSDTFESFAIGFLAEALPYDTPTGKMGVALYLGVLDRLCQAGAEDEDEGPDRRALVGAVDRFAVQLALNHEYDYCRQLLEQTWTDAEDTRGGVRREAVYEAIASVGLRPGALLSVELREAMARMVYDGADLPATHPEAAMAQRRAVETLLDNPDIPLDLDALIDRS